MIVVSDAPSSKPRPLLHFTLDPLDTSLMLEPGLIRVIAPVITNLKTKEMLVFCIAQRNQQVLDFFLTYMQV